jgi:hypothetical protein
LSISLNFFLFSVYALHLIFFLHLCASFTFIPFKLSPVGHIAVRPDIIDALQVAYRWGLSAVLTQFAATCLKLEAAETFMIKVNVHVSGFDSTPRWLSLVRMKEYCCPDIPFPTLTFFSFRFPLRWKNSECGCAMQCNATNRKHIFPLLVCVGVWVGVRTLAAVIPSKRHIFSQTFKKFDMDVMSSEILSHFYVSVPLIPAWANL